MHIKKIVIKNFRSIKSATIDLDNINVFYGLNDVGKSNVLKALNLFFNNKISHAEEFSFSKNFCNFSKVSKKKAPEIVIAITLSPPASYKDNKEFVWKKVWRKESVEPYDNCFIPSPEDLKDRKLSPKYTWAKKIKYRYVPAMKDDHYFSNLLKELYEILSESISDDLHLASNTFLEVIKKSTREMSNDLYDKLGFRSEINFPDNLSSLFSTLEFNTESGSNFLSLNNRGDGIKIRHIPSILHFFHSENNKLNTNGTIRTDTIWGYEEPENNLEVFSAFKKSKQFNDISDDIQILLTTHSPAFYLLKSESSHCKLLQTIRDDKDGTKYNEKKDLDLYNVEEDREFLILISDYIQREVMIKNELEQLKEQLSSIKENKVLLITEGKTDKKIIECAWSKLYPDREIPFEIIPSGISIDEDERNGGAKFLKQTLEHLSTVLDRTVIGLFDNDKEGVEQLNGLNKKIFEKPPLDINIIRKHKSKPFFAITLPVPEERERQLFVTKDDTVHRYFVIEHYFSDELLIENNMKGKSVLNSKVFCIEGNKNNFSEKCSKFKKEDFREFKLLFDKLNSIANK